MSADGLLLAVVAVPVSAATVLLAVRVVAQRRRDRVRGVFTLRFPAELDFDGLVAFLRALAGLLPARRFGARPSVTFEIVACLGRIEHRLRLPADRANAVVCQLYAALPGMLAEPVDNADLRPWRGRELRLTRRDRPLRTDDPAHAAVAILAGLQPLGSDETVIIQWVVAASRYPPTPPRPGTARARRQRRLRELFASPAPPAGREVRDKAAQPGFAVAGRVGAAAPSRSRARLLLRRVGALLHAVHAPGVALVWRHPLWPGRAARRVADAVTPATRVGFGCYLNARELAAVIAFPIDAPLLPGLAPAAARRLPPAAAIPSSGRVIGQATFPGQQRPLALPASEALHHLHVIGPTGVGKSTLLANLVCQDIAAGRGVVVIDPKGDLVADIADRIPAAQHDRVVVLDPTGDDRPVGLNLLHGAHRHPELVADQILGIFHRLYAAFWGPRTQDILHACLLTLAQPGMTLCELPLLLTNDGFRARLVARVDDPIALGPFWAWYNQLSPAERAQAIGPVMNKLRAFLLRRRVRNVIGQAEPTFTLHDVLAEPKVLLVSLAKGQLGAEAAALVGSLVVALLWQATQQRGGNRTPVMVFIDEFQDVLNLPTDLADVLAQARGFGVGLTLAHQHLGQLTPAVRAAVLANARSKIVFQTGAEDAPTLARHLGPPLAPADLQTLAAREVYAALTIDGRTSAPASAHTHPLPEPLGGASQVRELSRRRYGRDLHTVEAAIQTRHDRPRRPDHEQVGRQPRP